MSSDGGRNARGAKTFVAQFTKRDLMLYALGIGCCSGGYDGEEENGELRFVYEHHPKFEAFPTFLLSLPFIAERVDNGSPPTNQLRVGIRPFPPESMSSDCGILPKDFLKNQGDIEEVRGLPILHISQTMTLHSVIKASVTTNEANIDPPMKILIETRIIAVKPRSIGTFVTSETSYHQHGACVVTTQMVALILGLDSDMVVQWEAPPNNHLGGDLTMTAQAAAHLKENQLKEETTRDYHIAQNAALLYRLSGDYNPIHVEANLLGKVADERKQERGSPVLHGLCTMGYAVRAVLHHAEQKTHGGEVKFESLHCKFVKPVYVGDSIRVVVRSRNKLNVSFCVYRCNGNMPQSDQIVVRGSARFKETGRTSIVTSRL
ncbi:hypothetical protein ACHAWF_014401 [Thalassiosira exigua]